MVPEYFENYEDSVNALDRWMVAYFFYANIVEINWI
jgi:hypothetical protein